MQRQPLVPSRSFTLAGSADGGVQASSMGDIYPAVIAKVERYEPVLVSAHYELTLDGVTDRYATYDDARDAAFFLLSPWNADIRAQRKTEGGEL